MTKVKILAIIKYLLEKITGKLQGKADVGHTHSDYASKEHTHSEATISKNGFLSAADKQTINNLPNVYAKKSDVVNVYRYKGSVDTYNNLPNKDLNSGDVYNVEDTGKNYAWTGSAWDDLGGSFEVEEEEITVEEVERICKEVWGE